jgi:hypothetical protein
MNYLILDFIRGLLATALLFTVTVCQAWETLTRELDLSCNQVLSASLECEYRTLAPFRVQAIRATRGESSLNVTGPSTYPAPDSTTAILFVVDTSDPARQNVIDKNIKDIELFLAARSTYHRFGLASFDKELRMLVPIGAAPQQVFNAAGRLRAVGMTTELYRNVIKAIEAVAAVEADRKAIILFSDGQAEDRAYYHQDAIRAARRLGVVVNSVGYPRSVTLSVALQTIRRLSEESGGIYVEANNLLGLPASFTENPYANLDSGGKFSIELSPVADTSATDRMEVTLRFLTDAGSVNIPVPITRASRPVTAESTRSSGMPAATNAGQPAIRIVAPVAEPEEIDIWLWYGIPVAFLILIILTLIILGVTFQQLKIPKSGAGKNAGNTYKPYAYLVVQDESGIRYPITSTTWRIGRTKDNELTLNDKSVSRRHAEIQRYSNGKFVIFDVDSLNGVFVNMEQIKKKKLEEGDIIEIGDIYLRFTTRPAELPMEDDTAIQNTRTPLTH